jgi:hypothetical protein
MKIVARMSLKSLPDRKTWSGSCRNMGNVLFFHSIGCVSSSSSESIDIEMFFFFSSGLELDPTTSLCPFFFRSSAGKR